MRYLWIVLVCLAVAAGCGKKPEPGAGEQGGAPVEKSPAEFAPAEQPSPEAAPKVPDLSAPLTDKDVTTFVSVFPEVAKWAQEHGRNVEELSTASPMKGVQAWALATTLAGEAKEVLESHGLTAEQFAGVTGRVIQAYTAAMMEQQIAKMEADTAENAKRLNDPEVPEAEKAMIRATQESVMKIQQEMQQNLTAPKANIEVVRKHYGEIEQMFQDLQ